MPRLFQAVTWVSILFAPSAYADTLYAGSVTAEMRSQDARLQTLVRVHEPRAALGEFLERIGAQVSISLTAGDRDGAGDVEVAVFAHDKITVGDLMDRIWSLVSYKGAQWTWRREGEAGSYSYTLERPLRARGLAERLRAEMQEAIEKEVELMTELALLTPEQRQKRISGAVKTLFGGDRTMADGYMKSSNDRQWQGLATMAEVLSPDQRRSVLRGQDSFRINVNKLSPAGRAFVHAEWASMRGQRRRADGTLEPIPKPTSISFFAERRFPTKMIPMLLINMEGLGAYAYAGGRPAEMAAKDRMRKLWLQEGDQIDSHLAKGRFPKAKAPTIRDPAETQTEFILKQLADCAPFPIFVRLPSKGRGLDGLGYEEPYGRDRTEWLRDYFGYYYFQWKWRNNALLATNPAWFLQEDQVIPWKVLSNLRKDRNPSTGKLSIEAICTAASRLEWDQMLSLREQFPVMYEAASFHDMLAALHAKPLVLKRIQDPHGIPLKEALPLIRGVNDWRLDDILARDNVATVRITSASVGRATKWEVELLDRAENVVNSRGFVDIGYSAEELQAKQKTAGGQ